MAKFISFTSKKQTSSGTTDEIVFVNLDDVLRARYFDALLRIQTDRGSYVLSGQEAQDALTTLNSVQ